MNQIDLTSGRLTSLSRLLAFLSKNPGVDSSSALSHLVKTRAIQSDKLASEAEHLALELKLIEKVATVSSLTAAGRAILIGHEGYGALALQRRLLLNIILDIRRDLLWITFAKPDELRENLPSIYQILKELELLERIPGQEAIDFWTDLRRAEVEFNDAVKKKIGDQAEAWSMDFENARLRKGGHQTLAGDVVWISRESDVYGYDILSFSGLPPNPSNRRHLEVKRTKVLENGVLSFYLSRNEFELALVLGEQYLFHLWWLPRGDNAANLSVVPGKLITALVPIDKDGESRWADCEIYLKITNAHKTYFGAAIN